MFTLIPLDKHRLVPMIQKSFWCFPTLPAELHSRSRAEFPSCKAFFSEKTLFNTLPVNQATNQLINFRIHLRIDGESSGKSFEFDGSVELDGRKEGGNIEASEHHALRGIKDVEKSCKLKKQLNMENESKKSVSRNDWLTGSHKWEILRTLQTNITIV